MIYILVGGRGKERRVTAVTASFRRAVDLSKGGNEAEIYVINNAEFKKIFGRNQAMIRMLNDDKKLRGRKLGKTRTVRRRV